MVIDDSEAQNDNSRESGTYKSTEIRKYEEIESSFQDKKLVISENGSEEPGLDDQRKQSLFDFDIMNAAANADMDLNYLINQINQDIFKQSMLNKRKFTITGG